MTMHLDGPVLRRAAATASIRANTLYSRWVDFRRYYIRRYYMKYALTEQGRAAIATRCASLERRLRPVLLMCNGERSAHEILQATQGRVQLSDLQHLLQRGLIEPVHLPKSPKPAAEATAVRTITAKPGLPTSATAPVSVPPSTSSWAYLDTVPDSLVEQAHQLLARHIGPIARILIQRAVATALDREQFFGQLLQQMHGDEERAWLQRELSALVGPMQFDRAWLASREERAAY
jgi:hypothetical protein